MENRLRLKPRLAAVARQVRQGVIAADVGTDHGYLACFLAQEDICPMIYASDLNRAPLEQAARTVRECRLEGRVIPLLSDGVAALPLEEIDDVLVAGMGGDLILSIVSDIRLRDPGKRLVLQPMTKAEVLRRGLYRLGFRLLEETAVRDGRFLYTVLTAQYCGEIREVDPFFAETGLLSGKTEEEREYLNRVFFKIQKKMQGLQALDGEESAALLRLKQRMEELVSRWQR